MLDRSLAHALAQVTDPIVMVGPQMKLLYANIAARKLTDDKPVRILQTQAMRTAQAEMRAGTAVLPMRLSLDLDAGMPMPATLFDWRTAGGFIIVVRPDVPTARATPTERGARIPLVLKSGLAGELDDYFLQLERTFGTSDEAHEGEPLGVRARALRRSVCGLVEIGSATIAEERVSAERLIHDAWTHVASLAVTRGVEVSLHGAEASTIELAGSIEINWAFAEALAYAIRRVPEDSVGRPWRIEVRAYRAGVDAVIGIDSVGRVARRDAAAGVVLRASPSSPDARMPSGAGEGLPLVRAVLGAGGGRLEVLADVYAGGNASTKILFRFPAL